MGLYIIQGTQPKGAKNLKNRSKDGDDNDIKSEQYSYVVIKLKLYCHCRYKFVLKLRQFTLLRRDILNRLYRAYQYPHRYECISNCACRNIGMNTAQKSMEFTLFECAENNVI